MVNLFRRLSGYDVYISYSRADAPLYALALANDLASRGITCFLDQYGSPAENLPSSLIRQIGNSSLLVLIGTERAVTSFHVRKELAEFVKTGRPIVPISVNGSIENSPSFPYLEGLVIDRESQDAIHRGIPSQSIITRIENTLTFTRRNRRLRAYVFITSLLIVSLLILTASLLSNLALTDKLPKVGLNWGWITAAILGMLLVFRDLLKTSISKLSSAINSGLRSWASRSTSLQRIRTQRYQQALEKKYQPLLLSPKSLSITNAPNLYVPLNLVTASDNKQIDIFRSISEHRKLLVTGAPGSGKSTLLKFIVATYAQGGLDKMPAQTIPVFLDLLRPSNQKLIIKELLLKEFADNNLLESESFISSYLKQGKLLILLDGVDEISNEARDRVVRQIKELQKAYPSSRYVVTCRTSSYKEDLLDWFDETLTISNFDDQQIRRFLSAWDPYLPVGKSGEQLYSTICERPRVLMLARTPLLLTIIASLYANTSYPLPPYRADFFEMFITLLIDKKLGDFKRDVSKVTRTVLEQLALINMDRSVSQANNVINIEKNEVTKEIGDSLRTYYQEYNLNSVSEVSEAIKASGLLLPIDSGAYFQFAHISLQEYFVAAALRNDEDGLVRRFKSNRHIWAEPVKLWCGLVKDCTNLIRRIYKDDPVVALECLAEAKKVQQSLAKEIITLCKNHLGGVLRGEERTIYRALGTVAADPRPLGREVFQVLEETVMRGSDLSQRLGAAQALALTGLEEAASILANYYKEIPEIRDSLVRMGDQAVAALTTLARTGDVDALTDLRNIGTPKATDALTALLPTIGQHLEKLKNPRSVDIEFEGRSGFYINRTEILRLKVNNISDETLDDVVIEIDDTAKYSIDGSINQRQKNISELRKGEFRIVEFPIKISKAGMITLQLKVNAEVYKERLLEVHAVNDNPYFYGVPVRDALNFFGRENELQISLNNIQRESGTHTMIVGEQRSGKTSLLFQIRDRLKDPFIVLLISFSGMERDEKRALTWLLDKIISELKRKGHIQGKEYSTSLNYSTDFITCLSEIIRDVKSENNKHKLVLLLDEAHLMNEVDARFQEVLRESFIQSAEDLRVILACYYGFFDGLQTSGSPLHNIFEFIFLKPLEGSDLHKLICEPAARFDYHYEAKAVERVKEVSGGHPYYCQVLCAKSFSEAENSNTNLISQTHVENARRMVLASDKQRYKLGYWDYMSSEERVFLKTLVYRGARVNISKQVINRLLNKFLIKESRGRYYFTSELFEEWTKQLIQDET